MIYCICTLTFRRPRYKIIPKKDTIHSLEIDQHALGHMSVDTRVEGKSEKKEVFRDYA